MQQLGDHRQGAVEMPRAGGALPFLCQPARGDADQGLAAGIDLLNRRRKHQVHALGLQEVHVRLQRPRVALQVRGFAELQRVHEDAGHHNIVLFDGGAGQPGVPLMQGTHGGDQPL